MLVFKNAYIYYVLIMYFNYKINSLFNQLKKLDLKLRWLFEKIIN